MREDLLESAITFLKSPNVQAATKEKKVQFLEKKGLTKEEIDSAFKQIESNSTGSNTTENAKPLIPTRHPVQVIYYPLEALPTRMTTQQLIKFACVIALGTTGFVAILLTIVKKYMSKVLGRIAKYQSQRYKDRAELLKRLQTVLENQDLDYHKLIKEQSDLDGRLNQLSTMIQSNSHPKQNALKPSIDSLRSIFTSLPQAGFYSYGSGDGFVPSSRPLDESPHIQSLKSEIRSFKGALLSRRNFPTIAHRSPDNSESPKNYDPSTDSYHPRRKRSFRSELPSGFKKGEASSFVDVP